MKLTLVFLCAFAVFSHQKTQQRPRGMIWFSPYYSPQQPDNGYQTHYYNDAPYILIDFENKEFIKEKLASQDNLMDENEDYQSRILASFGQPQQNNARFFFNSNPFAAAMSAPIVTSVVTTIASIVTCVPGFQFLGLGVAPVPLTCTGRKKREMDDFSADRQFPIVSSGTLKLSPTVLPSFHRERENRQLFNDQQASHESLISSKDDVTLNKKANADHMNLREKRFFFNNIAVTSISTSYIFVPIVLTQTVNLIVPPPTAQCDPNAVTPAIPTQCAACLPAGYIVCPP